MLLTYINVVHRLNHQLLLHRASPTWSGITQAQHKQSSDATRSKSTAHSSRHKGRQKPKAPATPTTPATPKKKKKKKKPRAVPIKTYSPAELAERHVAPKTTQPVVTTPPPTSQQRPPSPQRGVPPPPPTAPTPTPAAPLADTLSALGIADVLTRLQAAPDAHQTAASVEAVASLLQGLGLGLQPLRTLLIARPSLLLAAHRDALHAQLHDVRRVLSGGQDPTKAATAALRAMLRLDVQHGWRTLPDAQQLTATLHVLREALGISRHTAAKLGAANPAVLMQPPSTLQRRIGSLRATTRATPTTLRGAVCRAPTLLLLDDTPIRAARLQSMLAARCALSPAAVLQQVVEAAPEVLALSASAAGGTAGALARSLGAQGAGRLLSVAPTVLCMPYVGVAHYSCVAHLAQ